MYYMIHEHYIKFINIYDVMCICYKLEKYLVNNLFMKYYLINLTKYVN